MITEDKVIEIYSLADDFCKGFSTQLKKDQLEALKQPENIIATTDCSTK